MEKSSKQKTPSERFKVALIPVLAVVLIAVVWPSGEKAESANDTPVTDSPAPVDAETTGATLDQQSRKLKKAWPTISLSGTLNHDPFALPADLVTLTQTPADTSGMEGAVGADAERGKDAEQLKQRLAELQKRKVSLVLQGAAGPVALIDSVTVHEGDLLEPGIRVIKIASTGVVLQLETP